MENHALATSASPGSIEQDADVVGLLVRAEFYRLRPEHFSKMLQRNALSSDCDVLFGSNRKAGEHTDFGVRDWPVSRQHTPAAVSSIPDALEAGTESKRGLNVK